jgi:hypothetical protein
VSVQNGARVVIVRPDLEVGTDGRVRGVPWGTSAGPCTSASSLTTWCAFNILDDEAVRFAVGHPG